MPACSWCVRWHPSVPVGVSGWGCTALPSSKRWCGFIQLRSLFSELCSEGHGPAAGTRRCRERRWYPAKPKSPSDPDHGAREAEPRLRPLQPLYPMWYGKVRALSSLTSPRQNLQDGEENKGLTSPASLCVHTIT